jgi:hypothetical protein
MVEECDANEAEQRNIAGYKERIKHNLPKAYADKNTSGRSATTADKTGG